MRYARNLRQSGKAIFIDRDGVINKDPAGWTEHSYVTRPEDFEFLPGALEALRKLANSGYKTIVISNQAGVSKGYFTKEKLDEVNSRMFKEVKKSGGKIEESFYCIHKDEDKCNCRKPKTGLFEIAVKKYFVNTKETYFIGDGHADIAAGERMGLKTVFVLSGKTSRQEMGKWPEKPDYIFKNLLEAVNWLLAKEKRRSERALRRRDENRTKDEKNTDNICDSGDRA